MKYFLLISICFFSFNCFSNEISLLESIKYKQMKISHLINDEFPEGYYYQGINDAYQQVINMLECNLKQHEHLKTLKDP